jgi:hypothetical protein
MDAIPAHRTTDARRATTDLRVVIAGPTGMAPESPVTRHGSGESVGRMNPMIGRAQRPMFIICHVCPGRREKSRSAGENGLASTVLKVNVAAPPS